MLDMISEEALLLRIETYEAHYNLLLDEYISCMSEDDICQAELMEEELIDTRRLTDICKTELNRRNERAKVV